MKISTFHKKLLVNLVFGCGLMSWLVLAGGVNWPHLTSQAAAVSRTASQVLIRHGRDPKNDLARAPGQSDQSDAALEYQRFKRFPDGEAVIPEARYFAARELILKMPRYSTAQGQLRAVRAEMLDQPAPSTLGGWTHLGPEDDRSAAQFYRGAIYPDGSSYLGGTLRFGILHGTDVGGRLEWQQILNGDGGYVAIDPVNTNILYASHPGLTIKKSVDSGVTFTSAMSGIEDVGLFVTPFVLDPNDSQRLWTGGRYLWRTQDRAEKWTRASAAVVGAESSKVSA